MTARPTAIAASGLIAMLLAACGADTSSGAVPLDTIPDSATAEPIGSVATEAPTTTVGDDECPAELRVLEVAVEAYHAVEGRYPTSEQELVETEILYSDIAPYDVAPGGEVVRVTGVPCKVNNGSAPSAPMTAEQFYADLNADAIDELGGPECARELSEIFAAAARYRHRTDSEPESLDDLATELDVVLKLWGWDADRRSLAPAPGSPCTDLAAETEPTRIDACRAERYTLEVATEAYVAMLGVEPPDEQALLMEGLIRIESANFDLVDGVTSLAPGSRCADDADTQPTRDTTAAECGMDQRFLEGAVASYTPAAGRTPTEAELVEVGLLPYELLDYDVADDGTVVVAPDSNCEALIAESDAQRLAAASQPAADERECEQRRREFAVAIEEHWAYVGEPATESDLVASGSLLVESPDFDLGPDSTVVVAPGSICL